MIIINVVLRHKLIRLSCRHADEDDEDGDDALGGIPGVDLTNYI